MCGLVGIMGAMTLKAKDTMLDLLWLDTLRGKDATGIAAIRHNGDAQWHKSTVPGYEFVELNKTKDVLSLGDRAWIGHNRFGTVGKNCRANAHPFVVETDPEDGWLIIGAHNGTLKNKSDIDRKFEYGTDSEAFLNLIGKEKELKDAIAQAEGAWALTWYDGVDDTVNFLRNKERPLTFCFSKDKKVLIWASEAWMIRAAAGRNGLELGDGIFFTKEDTHYSFKWPGKDKEIADPVVTGGITGKPEKTFPEYQGGWVGYGGRGKWVEGTKTDTKAKESSETGSENSKLAYDECRGFEGKPIKRSILEELKKFGCEWCGDPIPTLASFAYLDADSLVCHKCINGTHYADTGGSKQLVLTPKQMEELARVRDAKLAQTAVQGRVG